VQHEILLKLLFYTAVRVNELVHIKVRDVDLDACKIFINRGKGAKCCCIVVRPQFQASPFSFARVTSYSPSPFLFGHTIS